MQQNKSLFWCDVMVAVNSSGYVNTFNVSEHCYILGRTIYNLGSQRTIVSANKIYCISHIITLGFLQDTRGSLRWDVLCTLNAIWTGTHGRHEFTWYQNPRIFCCHWKQFNYGVYVTIWKNSDRGKEFEGELMKQIRIYGTSKKME